MKNVYLHERDNGTIRVAVRVPVDDQVIRTSTTYYPMEGFNAKQNREAAELMGLGFIDEVRKEYEFEKEKRNPTFRDYYHDVYCHKAKMKLTEKTYEFNCNTNEKFFIESFGDVKLKDITKSMLQDKIQELVNKTNENLEDPVPILSQTVERYVSPFRSVISMAVRDGILAANPFEGGLIYPKQYNPIIKCMSSQDYCKVLLYLQYRVDTGTIDKEEVVVALALFAGLRRGELVALQWGDLENLAQDRLDCVKVQVYASAYKVKGQPQKRGKPKSTDSQRAFVVPELLGAILLVWKNRQRQNGVVITPKDFVVTGRTGGMVSLGAPTRWVTRVIDRCNAYLRDSQGDDYDDNEDNEDNEGNEDNEDNEVDYVALHSLRHTFAALLVRSNMDVETIKSIMGHEDIRTTDIYMYSFRMQEDDLMIDINKYNKKLLEEHPV